MNEKRKTRKTAWIVAVSLCAVGVAGFYFWHDFGKSDVAETLEQSQSLPAPRPVVVETVRLQSATQARSCPGSVRASREAQLAFRVLGPLVEVNVQPGDIVKKRQILMRIDPRDFQDRIKVLEAQLTGARAQEKNAKRDYERAEPLHEKELLSQSDFDRARSAYDTAVASVARIEAELRIAKHQLEDTSLRAPYDGVITAQSVENHEMVRAGQVVLDLQDIAWLEIAVDISENEIVHYPLKKGQAATAEFPSIAGKRYAAQLKEWSAVADPVTRTYALTFALPAPQDAQVLPGMTAEVYWSETGNDSPPAISILAGTVASDERGNSSVWVYDRASSTASQRQVDLGSLVGESHVVVLSGLSEGEEIVVAGHNYITASTVLEPRALNRQSKIQ